MSTLPMKKLIFAIALISAEHVLHCFASCAN
jgi:hypothetical protein